LTSGFTKFDGLISARGLDNNVTCVLQAVGDIAPDEEFVSTKSNDQSMGTVYR